MTQGTCRPHSLRLRDGRCVSIDDILALGQPGIVELASAVVLDDASDEDLADLTALPQTLGDDTQDVMVGAYNIAMNADLLSLRDIHTFTDTPAIVVGSGPSLHDHLAMMRSTYGQYLIVASASAVRPLLDNGIIPHIVAPKERTRYPSWCMEGCPSSAWYAGLTVVPDLGKQFTNGWCVGDGTPLSLWSGTYLPYAPGPTSGTHAMSVALMATSGPVYLVGMDNCGGHYSGYQGIEQANTDYVMCYDGVKRESKWLYRVARANMARKHGNRVINASRCAAMVDGISYGDIRGGGRVSMPTVERCSHDREHRFRDILRRLPHDYDAVWGMTQTAMTIEDTQLAKFDSPNSTLFHALFTPTVAQLSMERRYGLSDKDVVAWYRDATKNLLDMLGGTFNEMATIGGHYV